MTKGGIKYINMNNFRIPTKARFQKYGQRKGATHFCFQGEVLRILKRNGGSYTGKHFLI